EAPRRGRRCKHGEARSRARPLIGEVSEERGSSLGSYHHYHCPRCAFAVAIGGPEEFYLRDGERHAYGHPDPVSEEARARGVDGFWMTLWCTGCVAAKRLVTLELEEPCEPLDAWVG